MTEGVWVIFNTCVLYLTPGHRIRHHLARIITDRDRDGDNLRSLGNPPLLCTRREGPQLRGIKTTVPSTKFLHPRSRQHHPRSTHHRHNMSSTNYASLLGIHSEGAAILFAALYAVCLPYYFFRAWNNRTYVLIFLAIFCLRTSRSSPPSLQFKSHISYYP